MRICQVEIKNFRGIESGKVAFPKHAILLGSNNAGKSTIAESLALLFGRERMLRPISDWDFFGGLPKPDSRFSIVATITDFSEKQETDPTRFPEWFVGEHAARPVWWHEGTGTLSLDADPPDGTTLAAQVAITGRLEVETCEFETCRHFYHGDCDPFTDGYSPVPVKVLRSLGLFLLSSSREWDKLLSFGSSTFLKVVREYNALPGTVVEDLKSQLRNDVAKIEEASPFAEILKSAEKELRAFLQISGANKLVYRPTHLDVQSVLQSLTPHIAGDNDLLVPVARHGSGTISLQAFLLILAFAEQRHKNGQNFILVAEEPELHLHPSLHQRLVNRMRALSTQSITTTQSPNVAASYQPRDIIFVRNQNGSLEATPLRTEPISAIPTNSVRKLYLAHRSRLYEALMGGVVLLPEGERDYEWLSLWQRLAQSSEVGGEYALRPITIIPTSDAAIVDSFQEIARFRRDALPVVDGDTDGTGYLECLSRLATPPSKVIQYGNDAAVECLASYFLEPALQTPPPVLASLLPNVTDRTLTKLQNVLCDGTYKKNRELHENLVWESIDTEESCRRACEFFADIAAIAAGEPAKNSGWTNQINSNGVQVLIAGHVRRT